MACSQVFESESNIPRIITRLKVNMYGMLKAFDLQASVGDACL